MLNEANVILKEIISKKDISFLVLMLSMFLLPWSINLSTFTLIVTMALKIIQVLFNKAKWLETKSLKNATIIGFLFFAYILIDSSIQTGFIHTIKVFAKQYSHFILILIIPLLLRKKQENKLILYAFFTGTITAVLFVFLMAFINEITFDKYAFLQFLDIHHTYLSIYLLTLINYILVGFLSKKEKANSKTLLLLCLSILSFGVIYLLGSKVSMVIIFSMFIIHALPEISKKKMPIYLIVFAVLVVVMIAFNSKINVSYVRALDFRLQIWEESFSIFKNNLFFGNLKLPEKDLLNYNHYIKGKYYFLDSDLNSHNQYLSILMKYGMVGFVILTLYVVNVFRQVNIKTSKYAIREFLGFALIVLVVCYIENIIDRHHGIVYLTFFYNYYLVTIENEEN